MHFALDVVNNSFRPYYGDDIIEIFFALKEHVRNYGLRQKQGTGFCE